jgi:hypothetical protein
MAKKLKRIASRMPTATQRALGLDIPPSRADEVIE